MKRAGDCIQLAGRDGVVRTSCLNDVHGTSEARTNSLILSAPEETMDLLLRLIDGLDRASGLRASIKVFTLKKADANAVANTLQTLFLGTTTGARPGGGPGAVPGGNAP